MSPDPDYWLTVAVILAGITVIAIAAERLGGPVALARRAAAAWNRGKAVHDRVELDAAEKAAWRRIRRQSAREARQAETADADSEARPS